MKSRALLSLFILSLIFLLTGGCKHSYNYRIDGLVKDGSLEGKYIYLQEMQNNQLVNLDSAKVQNMRFLFQGFQDTAVIRELNFSVNTTPASSPLVFVLQPGSLKAFIDTVSYMHGTESNDKLHEYFLNQHYYKKRIDDLLQEYQMLILNDRLSDSLLIAFQGWYDILNQEMNDLSYDFILLNSNSIIGALVFLQSYPYLTQNQIKTILNIAGSSFKSVQGLDIIDRQLRTEMKVAVGKRYQDFSLPDVEGKPVSMSSYVGNGKWVLLNFWVSECIPCQEDISYLKDAYKRFHRYGLEILGISLDTNRESWINAVKTYNQPWIQLSDLKGWQNTVAELYAIQVLPYTVLIDPNGIICARGLRQELLLAELERLFSKK